MNKLIFNLLVISISLAAINSIANNCDPACGGSTVYDCSDFLDATSSPSKCYSCASGHVGGSGFADTVGALCVKGQCKEECAACKYSNDATQCYLCSYGFYDPVGDSTKATPCAACHPSCLSCQGNTANDCLTCADKYFDALQTPYVKGSCDLCDSKCGKCKGKADNCVNGCCATGFKKASKTSYECVLDTTSCAAGGTTCPTRPGTSPLSSSSLLVGFSFAFMMIFF